MFYGLYSCLQGMKGKLFSNSLRKYVFIEVLTANLFLKFMSIWIAHKIVHFWSIARLSCILPYFPQQHFYVLSEMLTIMPICLPLPLILKTLQKRVTHSLIPFILRNDDDDEVFFVLLLFCFVLFCVLICFFF